MARRNRSKKIIMMINLLMKNKVKKKMRILIFQLGRGKMGLDLTKESLLLREGIMS